jgi:hypothetical protein
VTTRVEVPHQLAGPLGRHAVVGSLVVLADGRAMARIPLLLASALPAVSPLTIAAGFITKPLTLLLLVAVLGAGIALIVRRRVRARAGGVPREAA